MRINLPRQVHGKYGTLRGVVDVTDRYGKQLIDAGLATPAPKPKKAKKAD